MIYSVAGGNSPLGRGFGERRTANEWLGAGVTLTSCHSDRHSGRSHPRGAGPHRPGSPSDQEQLTMLYSDSDRVKSL